ncbi:unnamed protein product [Prorocentrum cordatum]|uniref:cGMP-dependent protein kinase n=1 Tax=Prorocentrum cordatum TaxID=2364126 RepID=A0ABN9S0R8_9DINO|nr:unnamed protein product [Polarella glacialis]
MAVVLSSTAKSEPMRGSQQGGQVVTATVSSPEPRGSLQPVTPTTTRGSLMSPEPRGSSEPRNSFGRRDQRASTHSSAASLLAAPVRRNVRASTSSAASTLVTPRIAARMSRHVRDSYRLGIPESPGQAREAEAQRLRLHREIREKDADALAAIAQGVRADRFCQTLGDNELQKLFGEMEPWRFEANDDVVVQGEVGLHFFVVQDGRLEVLVDEQHRAWMGAGQSFGALSLLYQCPRTATVRARENGTQVWGVSGDVFRRVLRDHAEHSRAESALFLDSVRLFDAASATQRERLGELTLLEAFKQGDQVLSQGQPSNAVYFVRKGQLSKVQGGIILSDRRTSAKHIATLRPGDCFGERSVLFGSPESESVVADTACELLSINQKQIREVFGQGELSACLERALALSVLRTVPVISQLSFRNLHQIVAVMQASSHEPGSVVDASKRLLIVLDGEISGKRVPTRDDGPPCKAAAGAASNAVRQGMAMKAEAAAKAEVEVTLRRGQCCGEGAFAELVGTDRSGDAKQKPVAGLAKVKAGEQGARLLSLAKQDLSKALKGMGLASLGTGEKVPIFNDLSEDQINSLVGSFVHRKYTRGARVIEKGEMGNAMFIIESGELSVLGQTLLGTEVTTLGPGSCVGERELILGDQRGDQARASSVEVKGRAAELWSLDQAAFLRAVSEKMREDLVRRMRIEDTPVTLKALRHIRFIGVGGFGSVQLVEHRSVPGVRYALKRVVLKDGEVPEGIRQECALLAEVKHPLILQLVRTFKTSSSIYILTELITGGSLQQHLPSLGVMERPAARFYLGTMALALEALHDRLIVYRRLNRTYTITGTVVYISPEAIRGRGYGMEADFWALGVLAFQLSVGRDPFGHGETEDKLILEQILSEELAVVLRRLLAPVLPGPLGPPRPPDRLTGPVGVGPSASSGQGPRGPARLPPPDMVASKKKSWREVFAVFGPRDPRRASGPSR